MMRILKSLFNDRKIKEKGLTKDFFSEDIISKMLRLMDQYSFNIDEYFNKVNTVANFLDRLSFQIPEEDLKNSYELMQLKNYLKKSNLSDGLSLIELFATTLFEECFSFTPQNINNINNFMKELNNLFSVYKIPFQLIYKKESSKFFMDRINSPKEEENKKKIYEIIDSLNSSEVNEHFTNSLVNFAKRKYPESIEEAYLSLEKYLKIKINNHRKDVLKSYIEFKKLFNIERGLFKIHNQKIKERIDFVYTVRSDIKSHSDKELFDREDFLEETARFQLNEVMNLIILLNSFKKK